MLHDAFFPQFFSKEAQGCTNGMRVSLDTLLHIFLL